VIRELVAGGTTVLLTTQYLEEADALADDIVVLDHGRAVAQGSPAELKAMVGSERLEVAVETVADLQPAVAALRAFAEGECDTDPEARRVVVSLRRRTRLVDVVRALDAAGVDAVDVQRREHTLDDVFLTLTAAVEPELDEVAA
jgi:ABC-2 type transport system ATP-binding protein